MDASAENQPQPPVLPQMQPPPVPQAIFSYGADPMVTAEERSLAMLCHLLGIFTGFVGPLILWLVKKDSSTFVGHHGREALNFQLTLMIVFVALGSVTFVLMFVLIGLALIPVLIVLQVLAVVAEILAAVAAQNGQWHRYPFNIRMV